VRTWCGISPARVDAVFTLQPPRREFQREFEARREAAKQKKQLSVQSMLGTPHSCKLRRYQQENVHYAGSLIPICMVTEAAEKRVSL
jgi:hypothetical protein